MKSRNLHLKTWPLAVALILWAATAPAAPAQADKNAKAPAPPAEPPKSTFVVPGSPRDGRDPFFPLSTRMHKVEVVQTRAPAAVVAVADVKFNGVSGSSEHRLAILNNRTFAIGEEAEIMTNVGRQRVRCLEINEDSVIIEVGGCRRELHLRPGI